MTLKTLLPVLILASNCLFAQNSNEVKLSNGTRIEIRKENQADGRPINSVTFDRPQSGKSEPQERRLIVRFKNNPIAKAKSTEVRNQVRLLENEHRLFRNDFSKIHSGKGSVPKVLHEYKTTFNGFSVITDTEGEKKLRNLPYVASVWEDKKVKAIDFSSNQVIGADKVWSDFNSTGKGVVIGIIDTGIDYTHPDLGGTFGPTAKVIGGYDFVNEDNDPMDDHGHGTHVAGIAAANGNIKGVAPDAKLIAFKVLTADGWGIDSWILAAIERSADPDQNPETNDALDVVNMSLGRATDPDEPYSEAIANATAKGVTFVVAAGNDYTYEAVGTPGVAEDAITVAATDRSDVTAYFSSKGPTQGDYRIKPDVAAPGVEIYSNFLGGQYQTWNGTSMASPHVAGAAALLLEKHPDWSPAVVKAALMNTAKQTEMFWHQGAGRIDVPKAIQQEFVVMPGSISLGMITEENIKVVTTSIKNLSNQSKEFTLAVTGGIVNPSIAISIEPSSVNLAAGQEAVVTITFTIDPSLERKSMTEGYFGELVTSSGNTEVKTPIALVHTPFTKLSFSEPLPGLVYITGVENTYYGKGFYPTSTEEYVSLPSGQFDVIAYYDHRTIVIKETIDGSQENVVPLLKSQAKNEIIFRFKDVDNKPIDIDPNTDVGTTLFSTRRLIGFYFFPEDTFYISDNSYALIDLLLRDTVRNTYYDISRGTVYGQTKNLLLTNELPFSKIEIKTNDTFSQKDLQYISQGGHDGRGGASIYNYYPLAFTENFVVQFAQRMPTDNFSFSKAQIRPSPGFSGPTIESGFFGALQNDLLRFSEIGGLWYPYSLEVYNSKNFTYDIGASLLRWTGKFMNENGRLNLWESPSIGLFNYSLGERIAGEIQYELKANDQVVQSGTIHNRIYPENSFYAPILSTEISQETHELNFHIDSHKVLDKSGYANVKLQFNPSLEDKNPPFIEMLTLESQGYATNKIVQGEGATFRMAVNDCRFYYISCHDQEVSAKFFVKHDDEAEWTELALTKSTSDTLVATFSEEMIGYYSIRVLASDESGNKLEYELSPAFFVASEEPSIMEKVTLTEPANHIINLVRSPVFKWQPLQNALSYTFQLSKSSSFAILENAVTQESTTLNYSDILKSEQTYFWRVKANYQSGSGPWSTANDFKTEELKVELLEPLNSSTQYSHHAVNFNWKQEEVWLYQFQLSRFSDFSVLEWEEFVSDPQITYQNFLSLNAPYYWRVRSIQNDYDQWSEMFTFEMVDLKVTLLLPGNSSQQSIDNIEFKWANVDEAIGYDFQLSDDATFNIVNYDVSLPTSNYIYPHQLPENQKLFWRVRPTYTDQWQAYNAWSDPFNFTTIITGLNSEVKEGEAYAYPNPFTEQPEIVFYVKEPGELMFTITDSQGRTVSQFKKMVEQPGRNSTVWEAKPFIKGLYFCKISSATTTENIKLVKVN
jgi:hypothetical protein